MLYRILKILIGLAIKLYYKEIRIKNRSVIDEGGPMIIIANHPNTLMDAWMVGHICRQPIYYMAKATFFSSPFKRWFLGGLGMIPINRSGDGKTKGVSNEDSFEACYKILEQGKTLVIFPEGNSYGDRHLRQLKSGTARIALEALKRNQGELNVKVVPMGLVYMKAEKFRSSVLINIGPSIDPKNYLEAYMNDSLKAARGLTEEFRVAMERLLVSSQSKEQELLGDQIVEILHSSYMKSDKKLKGVEEDVHLLKTVHEELNSIYISQPWKVEEIEHLVFRIKWKVDQLAIRADFFDRRYRPYMFVRQLILSVALLIVGLPVFIYGLIHNYLQYKLIDISILKLVKDIEYYAPIAVLMSLLLYPLVYMGFVIGVNLIIDLKPWQSWLYFTSMPLSGMLAYYFALYLKQVSFKWRFVLLMKKDKDKLKELKEDREKLREMLFS